MLVSQSGETADALAALRYMREQNVPVLSMLNVPGEHAWRARATRCWKPWPGPEIAVASTKAFTAQLTVLACLALAIGRARGVIDAAREAAMTDALLQVPAAAASVLEHSGPIQALGAADRAGAGRAVSGPRRVLSRSRWKAR